MGFALGAFALISILISSSDGVLTCDSQSCRGSSAQGTTRTTNRRSSPRPCRRIVVVSSDSVNRSLGAHATANGRLGGVGVCDEERAHSWRTRQITILTYLFELPQLMFGAGIIGRATIAVSPYLNKTYDWRWINR